MSTTGDRKENQVYELGYLLLPSLVEESLSDAVQAIKGIIKKAGFSELDSEDPLKMDLAYTMSKTIGARKYVVDEAYIGWVKFEGEGSSLAEVNAAVTALDEVLRFLIVKAPRETVFTFASAEKARKEKEMALEAALLQAEGVDTTQEEKVVE